MRLSEIKSERYVLNEIFDTKVDVKWSSTKSGYVGSFILDNKNYEMQIDEYEAELSKKYNIVDFGFTREGSWDLTNDSGTSSSKIFGAIFNSFAPKISELKPDIIVFGVNNRNGGVEERKALYLKLTNWWCRGTAFKTALVWEKTPNGQYTVLARGNLPEEDVAEIKTFIKTVPVKPE